jgi:hypothetical protein
MLCLGYSCSLALALPGSTITKTYADNEGLVHIVTADGRDHAISPEKGQDGVGNIKVAPDGVTAGWLVNNRTCCVSYAVPLELVLWQAGHIIRRVHPTMAIWAWGFAKDGKEIAYRNSPLHGGWSGECVLVDIASGEVLATWNYPVDENGNDVDEKKADDNGAEPDWAKQIADPDNLSRDGSAPTKRIPQSKQ